MFRLLILHIFVFSGIHCTIDNKESQDLIEVDRKYNSELKDLISISKDESSLQRHFLQKLINFLSESQYKERNDNNLKTSQDILKPRILDEEYIPVMPKIHIHHIFPPHLIRPLQKEIIEKLIEYIRDDPLGQFQEKIKKKARIGTIVLGIGLGIKELKELKSHPLTANYKVTGMVDLSQKHKNNFEEYSDLNEKGVHYRHKRSATFPVVEDTSDPDYKTVKDYKLIPSKKHDWPFHESKEEIYEKWNKFPAPEYPDPFIHKVKNIHRSFHELQPDILHLIQDVHGMVGTKTKIIDSGPDLEHPIVLAGQLIKLADSLIPSIRIRIPFFEYLKKSFYEKSKPKVIYIKSPPKVKYVGLPYREEEEIPMPEPHMPEMPESEPLKIDIPINVNVPMPHPKPHPMPNPMPNPMPEPNEYRRQETELNRFNPLVSPSQPFTGRPNYDSSPPTDHKYSQMFDEALRIYQDKSKAKA